MDLSAFMPHGMCYLWRPDLLGMHVIADLLIAIAYFSIPISILYLLRTRRVAVPFRWVFTMFATFILLCGLTHVMAIVTIWYPLYYVQGVLKILTAAVSIATAALVFPLVPTLIEMFASRRSSEDRVDAHASPGRA